MCTSSLFVSHFPELVEVVDEFGNAFLMGLQFPNIVLKVSSIELLNLNLRRGKI